MKTRREAEGIMFEEVGNSEKCRARGGNRYKLSRLVLMRDETRLHLHIGGAPAPGGGGGGGGLTARGHCASLRLLAGRWLGLVSGDLDQY